MRTHRAKRGACLGLLLIACTAFVTAAQDKASGPAQAPSQGRGSEKGLEQKFQAAQEEFEAGHYPEAAAQLEKLLQQVPQSFEVHELLGLAYSALSKDAQATGHLERAARLRPDSAAARVNLATNLIRTGKPGQAEGQFRKAIELEPQNFDANHNLGEMYVQAGKVPAGVPYLERAQRVDPTSYDNGYDLTLAYTMTGRIAEARQQAQALLKLKDLPDLHNLLGEIEEKDGKYVEAVNQFELAAHGDPSESNLFDWASELLLHRTLDPAVEVFQHASERYPKSPRLTIGLGMALYARGNYDDAVKALLRGADLDPADPSCYLFLSKAYDSSPGQAGEVIERFRRFAELQPNNARAQYYLAMGLWKGKRAQDPTLDPHQIEALLKRSIALDPGIPEAHLQLGNLYADQSKFPEAIAEYLRARELGPDLSDVRYRLGQAYVRSGEKEKAQTEFEIYQKLREQHLAEVDKQRADIRQFVYAQKGGTPAAKQ